MNFNFLMYLILAMRHVHWL